MIWENTPYGINAQLALCAFLVPEVQKIIKLRFLLYSCLRTFLLSITGGYGG